MNGKNAAQISAADGKIRFNGIVQPHGEKKFLKVEGILPYFLIKKLVGKECYVAVRIQDGKNIIHMAEIFLVFSSLFVIPVDGVNGMCLIGCTCFLVKEKICFFKEDDIVQAYKKVFHTFLQKDRVIIKIGNYLIYIFNFRRIK